MVVINKSSCPRYSNIADRLLKPGQKSADNDASGLRKALESIVGLGGSFIIRLNAKEHELLNRVLALDKAGTEYKCYKYEEKSHLERLLEKEAKEKRELTDKIVAEREKQAAIMAETTFTNAADVAAAREAAVKIGGDVKARKLATTGAEPVSISDLMSDNKFIEENMKHSHIATAVASQEGWDMTKMNEKAAPESSSEKKEEPEAAAAESTEQKKPRSRKGRKVNG